jgi:hypothetical protein
MRTLAVGTRKATPHLHRLAIFQQKSLPERQLFLPRLLVGLNAAYRREWLCIASTTLVAIHTTALQREDPRDVQEARRAREIWRIRVERGKFEAAACHPRLYRQRHNHASGLADVNGGGSPTGSNSSDQVDSVTSCMIGLYEYRVSIRCGYVFTHGQVCPVRSPFAAQSMTGTARDMESTSISTVLRRAAAVDMENSVSVSCVSVLSHQACAKFCVLRG